MKSTNLLKPTKVLLLLSCAFTLLTSENETAFLKTDTPVIPKTTSEISSMMGSVDKVPVTRGTSMFLRSFTLNGQDIFAFLDRTNAQTISVFHGYFKENDFSDANKVIVILPVNENRQTMKDKPCMVFGKGIMRLTTMEFAKETINPYPSESLPLFTFNEASRYIANAAKNPLADPVRGLLIERTTLDYVIKMNGDAITFNFRVHYGVANGERMACATAVNLTSGTYSKRNVFHILNGTTLCPNNCDFY